MGGPRYTEDIEGRMCTHGDLEPGRLPVWRSGVSGLRLRPWHGRLLSFFWLILAMAVCSCGRQAETTAEPQAGEESDGRPLVLNEEAPSRDQGLLNEQSSDTPLSPESATTLPIYDLTLDLGELRQLEMNPYSPETCAGVFKAGDQVFDPVEVRFRGQWARSWPKKPLKVLLEKGHPFEGHRSINLNSAWRDPAFVRELVAYRIFVACGVPASKVRPVRVHVNGRFRGVYLNVEQPDKSLLERHGLKGAQLFKAISDERRADERDLGNEAAYARHYEIETRKTEGFARFHKFCQDLAVTADVDGFFERNVDVDRYVSYLAACILVQHWDGFNKNHLIGCDLDGSGKWFVVPWDLDRTLGDHWNWSFDEWELPIALGTRRNPGVTGWNRLQDRFFSSPKLVARLRDRLEFLLGSEFTTEKLFPMLDQLEAEIGPDVALDRRRWPGPAGDLHSGIRGVKRFIENRRTYLHEELAKLR